MSFTVSNKASADQGCYRWTTAGGVQFVLGELHICSRTAYALGFIDGLLSSSRRPEAFKEASKVS